MWETTGRYRSPTGSALTFESPASVGTPQEASVGHASVRANARPIGTGRKAEAFAPAREENGGGFREPDSGPAGSAKNVNQGHLKAHPVRTRSMARKYRYIIFVIAEIFASTQVRSPQAVVYCLQRIYHKPYLVWGYDQDGLGEDLSIVGWRLVRAHECRNRRPLSHPQDPRRPWPFRSHRDVRDRLKLPLPVRHKE